MQRQTSDYNTIQDGPPAHTCPASHLLKVMYVTKKSQHTPAMAGRDFGILLTKNFSASGPQPGAGVRIIWKFCSDTEGWVLLSEFLIQ